MKMYLTSALIPGLVSLLNAYEQEYRAIIMYTVICRHAIKLYLSHQNLLLRRVILLVI